MQCTFGHGAVALAPLKCIAVSRPRTQIAHWLHDHRLLLQLRAIAAHKRRGMGRVEVPEGPERRCSAGHGCVAAGDKTDASAGRPAISVGPRLDARGTDMAGHCPAASSSGVVGAH